MTRALYRIRRSDGFYPGVVVGLIVAIAAMLVVALIDAPADVRTGPKPVGFRYVEDWAVYSAPGGALDDTTTAPATWTRRSRHWVTVTLHDGYEISDAGQLVAGDPRTAEAAGNFAAGRSAYRNPLSDMEPPLDQLPTEPTAMRLLLTAAIKDLRWSHFTAEWPPGSPTQPELELVLTRTILALLADAEVTPAQRRALFEALKRSPAARPAPGVQDALGRTGDSLVIVFDRPKDQAFTYTAAVDPRRGALRFWSESDRSAGRTQSHTVIDTGHVDWLGERPRRGR